MESIWLLTKKNIQLLLRSRGSALIVVFAPLLLILVLGLSYDTQGKYAINIGVSAPTFTEDVNAFVAMLQEEQEFKVVKYEGGVEPCVDDIKSGYVHTCIVLPESLAVDSNTAKEITFYVDPSRINLVWMVQQSVQSKFDFKSEQISQGLSTDLLTRLNDAKTNIEARKGEISSIKDKNNAASSNTQTAKTSLQGVDLTAPATLYDVTVLTTAGAHIDSSKTILTTALTTLNTSNISSSDKVVLEELLLNASMALNNASMSLSGESNTSVAALVATIEGDLNSAKAKLSAAAEGISSTSSSLDSTTATLQESITAMDGVLMSLDQLKANLEGQKVTDAATITSPLVTKIEKVSPEGTYLNYLFPALLVLVVMFGSLLLGTTLVMIEKNSPAFLRNYFVPLHKMIFILSTYLTNLILILIQIVVIILISLIFLPSSVSVMPGVALILFIAASIFTFIGMIVGYIFSSEETATLGSISLGTLFLTVSGVILPLEGISPMLREIIFYNPFVVAERVIRELFIFNGSLGEVGLDLLILVGYMVILFLLIVILESVLHKHLVERFMKNHHRTHRPKDKVNKSDF